MKAKVKYQEVDFIQYDCTNKEEIEEFIGQHCAEYEESINKQTLPFLCFRIDSINTQVYRSQYIVKANNKVIAILWEYDFFRLFEPVND